MNLRDVDKRFAQISKCLNLCLFSGFFVFDVKIVIYRWNSLNNNVTQNSNKIK